MGPGPHPNVSFEALHIGRDLVSNSQRITTVRCEYAYAHACRHTRAALRGLRHSTFESKSSPFRQSHFPKLSRSRSTTQDGPSTNSEPTRAVRRGQTDPNRASGALLLPGSDTPIVEFAPAEPLHSIGLLNPIQVQ